ncbi:hypothetical protein MmTuc01_3344 [Methanosarcina mazei Tuc01]|uniref:Uncharacterized protein n=1 Tax=Methanosarcina mazei Tuc01 TaxID=1236903 RepID=M1QEC2_METMZ|nr:hypothetical protein MmTuc01_3344 [Methanosarcina mazei Tuc01]
MLLEWATIQQLDAYEYGSFLVMLGPVPVVVGVAWGTIIYSVRGFSDRTSLPEWARPVLDGLMGLNIDLSWGCGIGERGLIISTSVFLTTTSGHGSGLAGVLITNELITNIPNDLIHYATIVAVLGSALLILNPPFLLVVSIVMSIITLWLHRGALISTSFFSFLAAIVSMIQATTKAINPLDKNATAR